MEPIIKEKETVYVDGYNGHHGGGGNLRGKANWGLGLGIAGTVLGGAALADALREGMQRHPERDQGHV